MDTLERLMRRGVGLEHPGHLANLYIARWRASRGEIKSALAASRRMLQSIDPVHRLLFPAYHREEGQLAAQAGDTAGAVHGYKRYLALRDDPSPGSIADEVKRVRAHMAELIAASPGRVGRR